MVSRKLPESKPESRQSAPVPDRNMRRGEDAQVHVQGASEETELLQNDAAERPVSGIEMDGIGESGDRDPLIGSAVSVRNTRHGNDETDASSTEMARRGDDVEDEHVRGPDRGGWE
jgi:hypothetical protein